MLLAKSWSTKPVCLLFQAEQVDFAYRIFISIGSYIYLFWYLMKIEISSSVQILFSINQLTTKLEFTVID